VPDGGTDRREKQRACPVGGFARLAVLDVQADRRVHQSPRSHLFLQRPHQNVLHFLDLCCRAMADKQKFRAAGDNFFKGARQRIEPAGEHGQTVGLKAVFGAEVQSVFRPGQGGWLKREAAKVFRDQSDQALQPFRSLGLVPKLRISNRHHKGHAPPPVAAEFMVCRAPAGDQRIGRVDPGRDLDQVQRTIRQRDQVFVQGAQIQRGQARLAVDIQRQASARAAPVAPAAADQAFRLHPRDARVPRAVS
jgi:hypothetical protein